MLLHRARLRRLPKCIQNTHRKLILTKVNFGSKFVFKTDLYCIRRSAQIHGITSLSSRSITRSATGSPFKNFRCHTITNNLFFLTRSNLVPRSRGWAKPKARSGQVRKFDFFDWLFQNMAVTALKFERALRGFSGPLGNSMSVFMQIRHCARNHNTCILGTFICLQSASKVKKISSQFFIAL